MKQSPYFADQFRFFFKRFSSSESLFKWFLKKAGEDSQAFDFPGALKNNPKTLVFLPRDMESAAGFLHKMPNTWFNNVKCVAHESLHALISAKRAHAIYFSDAECRFGERVFGERIPDPGIRAHRLHIPGPAVPPPALPRQKERGGPAYRVQLRSVLPLPEHEPAPRTT